MPEEEAFGVLLRLMETYRLRELYKPAMTELGLCMFQLECLVQELLPDLHMHFRNMGFDTSMYASSWFLTLFATQLPLELANRIMDVFVSEVGLVFFALFPNPPAPGHGGRLPARAGRAAAVQGGAAPVRHGGHVAGAFSLARLWNTQLTCVPVSTVFPKGPGVEIRARPRPALCHRFQHQVQPQKVEKVSASPYMFTLSI